MWITLFVAIAFLIHILWVQISYASVPRVLSYQLRLTDSSGIPVADGTVDIIISIYDDPTAGSRIHTDCGTVGTPTSRKVVFTNGVGSVLIGDTAASGTTNCSDASAPNAIAATVFDSNARYLGITVEADAEMTPRKRIVAGAYSLNSDKLDDLDTSSAGGTTAFVPVTDSSGLLTLTGNPTTTTAVITANSAAATSELLFDLQTSSTSVFKVDAEGDTTIAGQTRITGRASTVITGSIDPTASTAVVGVGTAFTTELAVGDLITVSGATRLIVSITDNTNLTVDQAFTDLANDASVDRLPSSFTLLDSSGVGRATMLSTGSFIAGRMLNSFSTPGSLSSGLQAIRPVETSGNMAATFYGATLYPSLSATEPSVYAFTGGCSNMQLAGAGELHINSSGTGQSTIGGIGSQGRISAGCNPAFGNYGLVIGVSQSSKFEPYAVLSNYGQLGLRVPLADDDVYRILLDSNRGGTQPKISFGPGTSTALDVSIARTAAGTLSIRNAANDADAAFTASTGTFSGAIAANGDSITSDADLTITPAGGDFILADAVTFNVGGNGDDVAFNAIGNDTAGAGTATGDDDLYIEGDLEVDGSIVGSLSCTDCLDFDDFADNFTLDASASFSQGTNLWSQTYTGNSDMVTYVGDSITSGNGLVMSIDSLASGVGISVASTSTSFSSGSLLKLNKTASSGSTAFTGDVIDIDYQHTFNGGVGLSSTGNVIDLLRAITLNNVGETHTISGPAVRIVDNFFQSNGTLVNTADVLSISSNYGASTGSSIGITNSSTAGNGITITANSMTTGLGINLSMTGITTGSGIRVTGGTSLTTGGELLDLNMGAATAGNGAVITTTGVYTGTGLLTLTANSASTGDIIGATANALTTGSLINFATSGTFSGNLLQLVSSGASTGDFIDIASSNATATARVLNIDLDNGDNANDVIVLTSDETTTSGTAADTVKARLTASGEFFSDVGFTAGGASTVYRDGLINSSGSLSINTTNNQAISTGTGTFTVGGSLTMSNVTTDITTGSNETLTILANGSGDTLFTIDDDSNVQITQANTSTNPGADFFVVSTDTGSNALDGIDNITSNLTLNSGNNVTNSAFHGVITYQTSPSSTQVTNGLQITGAAITVNGAVQNLARLTPANSGNSDGTLIGLAIANIGTPGGATERAIQVGSGWDSNLHFDDTSTIISIADGGTFSYTDGTTTLLSLADGGTTGTMTLTGDYVQNSSATTGTSFAITNTAMTTGTLAAFTETYNSSSAAGVQDEVVLVSVTDSSSTSNLISALNISFINGASSAHTQNVATITNAATGLFTDNTTESLLLLDQADTTGTGTTTVTDGLRITNSGGSTFTNAITIGTGTQAITTAINIASTGVTTDIVLQNGETFDNDTNGTIVATATTFDVEGLFQLDINGGATDTTIGVCKSVADSAGTEADVELVDCNGTPGDTAEWYETTGNEQAAEIVVATEDVFTYTEDLYDPFTGYPSGVTETYRASIVAKSTEPYQSNVFGVVSTSPLQVMGEAIKDAATHPKPIALVGRVPLKVTNENGAIKAGDPITSSSIPGVGMKATRPGMIVGFALDSWNGEGEGKIMVWVQTSWYGSNGVSTEISGEQILPTLSLVSNGDVGVFGALLSQSGTWSLNAEGKLVSKELVADKVTTKELVIDQTSEVKAIGSAEIAAGTVSLTVENSIAKPNSKIFITLYSPFDGAWWISSRENGKFTITLSKLSANIVSFEYMIVSVLDPAVIEPEDDYISINEAATLGVGSNNDGVVAGAEDTAPVIDEVVSVIEELSPVAEGAAPIVEEQAPVVEEVVPIVEEVVSVVEEPVPVVEEVAPIVEEQASAPVVTEEVPTEQVQQ